MLILHGIAAVLFVLLGIIFSCGKGSFLIAGYNTASPNEKTQYDEKALCRAMGRLMFAIAACFCVVAMSAMFDNMAFLWAGIGLLFVTMIVGVVYMNTSKKVKRR